MPIFAALPGRCSCARLTLEAEERGQLTVFTCETCVNRARLWHGLGQLSFFPEERERVSVSALIASEGVKKKAAEAPADSSDRLPF